MTVTERLRLLQVCREFFQLQKEESRAAGKILGYRLEDLQSLVERFFVQPVCPYCRQVLRPADAMLTYRVPICRGGKFSFRNVEMLCRDCQHLRTPLDSGEFRELLELVHSWPKPVQNFFLGRLRAGDPSALPSLPPVGSLEWFTGLLEQPAGTSRVPLAARPRRSTQDFSDPCASSDVGRPFPSCLTGDAS
jgi:hypothetical protein